MESNMDFWTFVLSTIVLSYSEINTKSSVHYLAKDFITRIAVTGIVYFHYSTFYNVNKKIAFDEIKKCIRISLFFTLYNKYGIFGLLNYFLASYIYIYCYIYYEKKITIEIITKMLLSMVELLDYLIENSKYLLTEEELKNIEELTASIEEPEEDELVKDEPVEEEHEEDEPVEEEHEEDEPVEEEHDEDEPVEEEHDEDEPVEEEHEEDEPVKEEPVEEEDVFRDGIYHTIIAQQVRSEAWKHFSLYRF
jgi:hypothetical protein